MLVCSLEVLYLLHNIKERVPQYQWGRLWISYTQMPSFANGAKVGSGSKARLNHVQLSMVGIKGGSRKAYLFLNDNYPNGIISYI